MRITKQQLPEGTEIVVGGRSAFTVELLPREEKNSERKKY
jgi:hypothetical protein